MFLRLRLESVSLTAISVFELGLTCWRKDYSFVIGTMAKSSYSDLEVKPSYFCTVFYTLLNLFLLCDGSQANAGNKTLAHTYTI